MLPAASTLLPIGSRVLVLLLTTKSVICNQAAHLVDPALRQAFYVAAKRLHASTAALGGGAATGTGGAATNYAIVLERTS